MFCNVDIVLTCGAMLAYVSIFVPAVLSLHTHINTNTLSDVNLMMVGVGRNM